MQAPLMMARLAPRSRPAERQLAAAVHARWSSSFIRSVMDQVKKDMESNERLKKDWESVQATSEKLSETGTRQGQRVASWTEHARNSAPSPTTAFSSFREKAGEKWSGATQSFHEATESSESMKTAKQFAQRSYETGTEGTQVVFAKVKGVATHALDKSTQLLSFMDDGTKAEKLRQWQAMKATQAEQAAREAAAQEAADAAAATEGEAANGTESAAQGEPAQKMAAEEATDALVVSNPRSSSWDRFGAGIRDMPFLSNVFENPLFDRLFGESEIAASIREMKEMEPNFRLDDFLEDIEYVIAPHIVKTFLEGDDKSLERHCGEAAFAAVQASIKARRQQKMSLDCNILAGPKEVELKGAQLRDKGPPQFIWTFNTQQVNCLRDKDGEIIEGAVDDIRTVYYAMVVTKHPEPEKIDLEYPWQVSELAIVGNQPCW